MFITLSHRQKFIHVKNKCMKYSRDFIWATYSNDGATANPPPVAIMKWWPLLPPIHWWM